MLVSEASRGAGRGSYPELGPCPTHRRAGGEKALPTDPAIIFANMLQRHETEYDDFVRSVSFAAAGDIIHFADALAMVRHLVAIFLQPPA